jgi:hypothetical protein
LDQVTVMRTQLLLPILAIVVLVGANVAKAQDCSADALASAVDKTGAEMRSLNSNEMSALDAKLKRLQQQRGWSEEELARRENALTSDPSVTAYDEKSFALFTEIDKLSSVPPGTQDCDRLNAVEEKSKALLEIMGAKAKHLEALLDGALGKAPAATASAETTPPKAATQPTVPATKAPSDWTTATA